MIHAPAPLAELLEALTATARVVRLPLRVPFRGLSHREVLLSKTPGGWVEFSPFLEYDPQESARWLRATLTLIQDANPDLRGPFPPLPHVSPGHRVEVNATIPAVDVSADPQAIDTLMARYPGCTTVKIKVAERGGGQPFPEQLGADLRRVAAVRQHYAERGVSNPRIRVDANAGWSVDQACTALSALAEQGPLDYAEQPCGTTAELAELRARLARRQVPVRIAADELIRKAADPYAVVRAGACDVAVVKVAPLGGVDQVCRIAQGIAEYGVDLTVSSALETAVGMTAGLRAAAAIGSAAAGLATGSLFCRDVAARPICDGSLPLESGAVDMGVINKYEASPNRLTWWLNRVRAAAEHVRIDTE
ncbi:o-succinylbenzoate synthase [Corynebacterium heidelbergense]|uniref:o-succinylbenzoate synthase n=1 Tax=Corynebacterium heidelbergense TaxID=2055947 RepID=UPI001EE6EE81|nr:o-succinylbenzoate synthase [Corynebacterium heidelbergense]